MVDVAKLAIEVDSSQATAAAKNLDGLSQASGKAEKSVKGVGKGSQDAGKAAQNSSYKYRMASMQLSQVASQGSVTGNYLQALAIQLPDLALGFGTVGILAGSLAGALAVPLFTALGESEDATKNLSEAVAELGTSFSSSLGEADRFTQEMLALATISKEALVLRLQFEKDEAERVAVEALNNIKNITTDAVDSFSVFDVLAGTSGIEKMAESLGITVAEAKALDEAMPDWEDRNDPSAFGPINKVLSDLNQKYGKGSGAISEYAQKVSDASQVAIQASQQLERLDDVLNDVNGTLSNDNPATLYFRDFDTAVDSSAMSLAEWLKQQEQATAQYQALLASMVASKFDAEQKAAQALGVRAQKLKEFRDDDIISDQEYKAALLLAEEEYTGKIATIKKKQQEVELGANKETLAATGQFFETMAQIAQAGGEDQFQAWKRMAQAQAAVSASLAIINALASAPPPFNIALAGVIGVLGAVQIAQIEQQQYQARALGGQVKEGGQYLVGENGPEVVTMGSDGHITSNANSQQPQGNNFVFQISTGVSQTVKAELMSMMPMITKTAMQAARGRR